MNNAKTSSDAPNKSRKAQSFEYRGYHVDRVEYPSKNWRIGNVLTFWRVRELEERGRPFAVFGSRPEAKRRIDTEIDGPPL